MAIRAIALNGRFYDVMYSRTESGDVIGVRIAVLNQKGVHEREERLRERVIKVVGHYDLHYFTDCIDSKGNECAVLLLYWCAHLEKGEEKKSAR